MTAKDYSLQSSRRQSRRFDISARVPWRTIGYRGVGVMLTHMLASVDVLNPKYYSAHLGALSFAEGPF